MKTVYPDFMMSCHGFPGAWNYPYRWDGQKWHPITFSEAEQRQKAIAAILWVVKKWGGK